MVHIVLSDWLCSNASGYSMEKRRGYDLGFNIRCRKDMYLYVFDDMLVNFRLTKCSDLLSKFNFYHSSCAFDIISNDGEFITFLIRDSYKYILNKFYDIFKSEFKLSKFKGYWLNNFLGDVIMFLVRDKHLNITWDSELLLSIGNISTLDMDKKFMRFWIDSDILYLSFELCVNVGTAASGLSYIRVLFVFNMSNNQLIDFMFLGSNPAVNSCEFCFKSQNQAKLFMCSDYTQIFNGLFAGMLSRHSSDSDWG